jgi:hypothetical protein
MRRTVGGVLALLVLLPAIRARDEVKPPETGQQAPEIAGMDIDGKKLKLSDFRGKVVLLDFWGNW